MGLDESFVAACNHENGSPIIIGLINRHCRMLDTDRAMQESNHRFTFGFAVTVSHCHCGFFVESRSEEHTSELQSQSNLVCRLLLEKKKEQEPGRELPGNS